MPSTPSPLSRRPRVRFLSVLVSAASAAFGPAADVGVLSGPLVAQTPRVTITPAVFELEVGESFRLTAEVRGVNDIAPASLRWFAVGDVVSVSADGTVTATAPGAGRVAVVYEGNPAWATVRVSDLPPEELVIRFEGGPVDGEPLSTRVGTSIPLTVTALTRLGGLLDHPRIDIESQDQGIVTVEPGGRLLGLAAGRATVVVSAADMPAVSRRIVVEVEPNPAADYRIDGGPSAPVRTGDVVRLSLAGSRSNGQAVTGYHPLWTLSRSGATVFPEGGDGLFVAEESGTFVVTAVAGPAISRSVAIEVEPRTHTAHLERVGHGVTASHRAGDTWAFEGVVGRDYAYLGTFYHDWMKVFDVTDPATPVLTDSLQLDARRINDVKIHPDNRLGIVTREGASSRRNGIVLLDLANPAHPTILSEYTETVTGGVHNVWIRGDENLVYACHNGTNELHIIDISDPENPREVGRWGLEKESKTLHDAIVQDGYAYLSYWDDGVVMLDVGAGTHGGTPTRPAFVSSYSYPEGNTHVAWRHGKYLFVGDEIYPSDWDPEVFGPIEARGYVHVLDMTDIEHPVEVARYEVPEAGAHNLWTDDRDRLYIGYYQAGLRVVDVSGELRGDLYRQGREIGAVKTSSPDAAVPNWSMTWGAQVFKGRIFTSDLFSGLWVLRLVEEELVP